MLCPYLMQSALTVPKVNPKVVECRADCARRVGNRCADAVHAEQLANIANDIHEGVATLQNIGLILLRNSNEIGEDEMLRLIKRL